MITYKGFHKGLVCRGYQFKAREINRCDKAKTAREGFHSAENPLDVLTYYPDPSVSEYWMCEVSGMSMRTELTARYRRRRSRHCMRRVCAGF